MRIHLPFHPSLLSSTPTTAASTLDPDSPLVHIGGELVLVELQGELGWEGDKSDGVVGVLGLDRPDKPTLHLGAHHLLHGKMASLPKPLAVIRRAEATGEIAEAEEQADGTPGRPRGHIEGDASEEEDEDEDEDDEAHGREDNEEAGPSRRARQYTTPSRPSHASGSSPILPPSAVRDYSSDLDYSSPYRAEMDRLGLDGSSQQTPIGKEGGDESDEDDVAREADELRKRRAAREELAAQARKRKKRRVDRGEKERTRFYEVVGVVRKKVVFSLRPEPIVTATVLPD